MWQISRRFFFLQKLFLINEPYKLGYMLCLTWPKIKALLKKQPSLTKELQKAQLYAVQFSMFFLQYWDMTKSANVPDRNRLNIRLILLTFVYVKLNSEIGNHFAAE